MVNVSPLDRLTLLAAVSLEMPIAVISLLKVDQLEVLSQFGLDARISMNQSRFCKETLKTEGILVIQDANKDPRFISDPLVQTKNSIEFYAGTSIISKDGKSVGTICVMDHRARTWTNRSTMTLKLLSEFAVETAIFAATLLS